MKFNIKAFIGLIVVAVLMTGLSYAGLNIIGIMRWNFGEKLLFCLINVISITGVGYAVSRFLA